MSAEYTPSPSPDEDATLKVKRIAQDTAKKIHTSIESGNPIISVEMPQHDGVMGISVYAAERNMLTADTKFHPSDLIKTVDEANIAPVSVYLGHNAIFRALDMTNQLYTALDESNENATQKYATAQDTLTGLRNYMFVKERELYSLLIEGLQPDYPAKNLEQRVADELLGTKYEQPKLSLLQRLRPGSDTTSPRAIKSISSLHSENIDGLTLDVSRTRAWVDMHIANNANNAAIDTIQQIYEYRSAEPSKKARAIGKKSLEDLQYIMRVNKTYTSHIVDHKLTVKHLDHSLVYYNTSLESIDTRGLPDTMTQRIIDTRTQLLAGIALRSLALEAPLYNQPSSSFRYEPMHMHQMQHARKESFGEPRETIEVKPEQPAIDPELRAKQRSDERAARLEARRMNELQAAEELAAANERDLPKLAALNQLVSQYNELLTPFYSQSGKQLRAVSITGNNSLEFNIRKSAKEDFDDSRLLDRLRTYHGLAQMIGQRISYDEILAIINQADTLAKQHAELLKHTELEGTIGPDTLHVHIRSDLAWLNECWDYIRSAILPSDHRNHADDRTLDQIAEILALIGDNGRGEPLLADSGTDEAQSAPYQPLDNEVRLSDESSSTTPDQAVETGEAFLAPLAELPTIEQLNERAEQLDWIVLPTDIITAEDILQIAHKSLGSSGDKRSGVDSDRITSLLNFRKLYGGELYRSAERTLGDSNNLYFVLKFTHPEDEKVYAIAENVVFGNATYIIREDTMPLEPGESVLTAVTLSRKDARELGARRIIHTSNSSISHEDKITSAIAELSRKQSLA